MNAIINKGERLLEPAAPQEFSRSLPEKPLVVIERSASWSALDARGIWAHRELLYFLTWRDLKLRYKQAALGISWVVVQPLLTTLVFTFFFGVLARVPSGDVPYPLFAYAGLLPWTFFANALSSTSNSIVGNAPLITKVYFPRIIIPASALAGRLVDFGIAFIILVGLMVYYGVAPTWNVLMLPVLVALVSLFALACGLWASALNVKYRDVNILLPVLIQLWLFVSPILYPTSIVPAKWQRIYSLNPMVGIVEGFRSSLFNLSFKWEALIFSGAATSVLLLSSIYAFRRLEKSFADIV